MKVCLGGLLGDLPRGDLPRGDLGGDLGDFGGDFFTENMPPRLTRLTLLTVRTMFIYAYCKYKI